MGYTEPISTNPAMVLGGLKDGVTPLGWTYAYSTIANDGTRVSGTLAPQPGDSPVAFTKVTDSNGHPVKGGENDPLHTQVVSPSIDIEAKHILETVVTSGTGTHANVGVSGEWGKTGTTENNADAWFCGAITEVTACVWVGYENSTTPMTTLYNGGPVMGGTFPALIWARVISAWKQIKAESAAEGKGHKGGAPGSTYTPTAPSTESEAPSAPHSGTAGRVGTRPSRRSPPNRRRRRPPNPRPRLPGGGGSALVRRLARAGARYEATGGGAEAPRAVDRLGDADPRTGRHLADPAGLGREQQERVAAKVGAI